MKYDPGIGATAELSLRVSVATLVRVIFKHPMNDEWMLALERKATLRETKVDIKSQPFGGAIRILDLDAIHDLIGDFHFDSEHSHAEQDFRLFIQPSSWSVLREFCVQHLSRVDDPILETNPDRELTEEFFGALKFDLQPEQYIRMPVATVVENEAAPTENIHANGYPTVRVYRIFEASVTDPALIHAMLKNSESSSYERICELVLDDARNGGKGRVNTILALSLKSMYDFYRDLSPEKRNIPVAFRNDQLDDTVSAILEGVAAPKYQTIS